jgi:hypothetical protein
MVRRPNASEVFPMPYVLSIEPVAGKAFQHGFHLGTDLALAKTLAAEMFVGRNNYGMPTRTVALKRDGRIVDVFDGRWSSEDTWGE